MTCFKILALQTGKRPLSMRLASRVFPLGFSIHTAAQQQEAQDTSDSPLPKRSPDLAITEQPGIGEVFHVKC